MKLEEISQKTSKLLEAGSERGRYDSFLSKIVLEAKETAVSLMGEKGAKEAVVKAFLELVLAARMMNIDLDSEIESIFRKKIAEELAEAS